MNKCEVITKRMVSLSGTMYLSHDANNSGTSTLCFAKDPRGLITTEFWNYLCELCRNVNFIVSFIAKENDLSV